MTIVMLLAVLIITFFALLSFLLKKFKPDERKNDTGQNIIGEKCMTQNCLDLQNTFLQVSLSRKPCDNFFLYVCERWSSRFIHSAASISRANLLKVANDLDQEVNKADNLKEPVGLMSAAFKSCVNTYTRPSSQDKDLKALQIHFKEIITGSQNGIGSLVKILWEKLYSYPFFSIQWRIIDEVFTPVISGDVEMHSMLNAIWSKIDQESESFTLFLRRDLFTYLGLVQEQQEYGSVFINLVDHIKKYSTLSFSSIDKIVQLPIDKNLAVTLTAQYVRRNTSLVFTIADILFETFADHSVEHISISEKIRSLLFDLSEMTETDEYFVFAFMGLRKFFLPKFAEAANIQLYTARYACTTQLLEIFPHLLTYIVFNPTYATGYGQEKKNIMFLITKAIQAFVVESDSSVVYPRPFLQMVSNKAESTKLFIGFPEKVNTSEKLIELYKKTGQMQNYFDVAAYYGPRAKKLEMSYTSPTEKEYSDTLPVLVTQEKSNETFLLFPPSVIQRPQIGDSAGFTAGFLGGQILELLSGYIFGQNTQDYDISEEMKLRLKLTVEAKKGCLHEFSQGGAYTDSAMLQFPGVQQFYDTLQLDPKKGIDTLSEPQLFFVGLCIRHCGNPTNMMYDLCNAVATHIASFADAFSCPPGSNHNPPQRCTMI